MRSSARLAHPRCGKCASARMTGRNSLHPGEEREGPLRPPGTFRTDPGRGADAASLDREDLRFAGAVMRPGVVRRVLMRSRVMRPAEIRSPVMRRGVMRDA